MKCEMTITRNLKGYYQINITTPTGTKLLVNPVCKDKKVLAKLLFKIACEYEEETKKSTKSAK